MNNPYRTSFNGLRTLYIEYQLRTAAEGYVQAQQAFTREEIKAQLDAKKGPIIDRIWVQIRKQTTMTEFVEVIAALQLADFYFPDEPNEEKQIWFELRRGVDSKSIHMLEELTAAFEDSTHVDCLVACGDKKIAFQIKRYRGDNTAEALIAWLKNKVFKRYGPMDGTTLVVIIQSINGATAAMDLGRLEELFTKDAASHATFDEVELLYTNINPGAETHLALHKLLREHRRLLIPSDWAMARLRGEK